MTNEELIQTMMFIVTPDDMSPELFEKYEQAKRINLKILQAELDNRERQRNQTISDNIETANRLEKTHGQS